MPSTAPKILLSSEEFIRDWLTSGRRLDTGLPLPEATRITGLPPASIGLVLHAHPSSSVMQAASANTLVLIPARMAATRLPGKPLIDIHGVPMIVHVLRRAQEAGVGAVAVATDSAGHRRRRPRPWRRPCGDDPVSTTRPAPTASMRRWAASTPTGGTTSWSMCRATCRPSIRPRSRPHSARSRTRTWTSPPWRPSITTDGERTNPNVVKAIGDEIAPGRLRARTFTRANATGAGPHYHHIGLYALPARNAGEVRQAAAIRK